MNTGLCSEIPSDIPHEKDHAHSFTCIRGCFKQPSDILKSALMEEARLVIIELGQTKPPYEFIISSRCVMPFIFSSITIRPVEFGGWVWCSAAVLEANVCAFTVASFLSWRYGTLGKQKHLCVFIRVGTGANNGIGESWSKKGSVGSHPGTAASCRGCGRSIYLFTSRHNHGCTHPLQCLLCLEPSHTHTPHLLYLLLSTL